MKGTTLFSGIGAPEQSALQGSGCTSQGSQGSGWKEDVGFTLNTTDEHGDAVLGAAAAMSVRRLTPRECERLQGFPDDFTNIAFREKLVTDGNRYRVLGNSMAVPVIGWILDHVRLVDDML